MRASLLALVFASPSFVLGAAACSGVPYSVGADQPVRIREGTYRKGPLPGTDAGDAGALVSPTVTGVDTPNAVIASGMAGKVFSGRTSTDAYAIAIGFLDAGSAHWVLPVGAPDPTTNGELSWSATADFGRDLTPGVHTLGFVAIDAAGHAGTRTTLSVCVLPDVPDNVNACDPATFTPPNAVVSLSWSTDVDLDLVVVTPAGKVVRAKNPTTVAVDGGAIPGSALTDPSTGLLTRDSNGQCALDGVRRESLVFQGAPAPGTYRVYASLFQACSQLGTDYALTVYRAAADDAGGTTLARTELAGGKLLAVQATGGSTLGTYVTSVTFP